MKKLLFIVFLLIVPFVFADDYLIESDIAPFDFLSSSVEDCEILESLDIAYGFRSNCEMHIGSYRYSGVLDLLVAVEVYSNSFTSNQFLEALGREFGGADDADIEDFKGHNLYVFIYDESVGGRFTIVWHSGTKIIGIVGDNFEVADDAIESLLDAYLELYPSDVQFEDDNVPPTVACSDSDGGRNYYEKGYASSTSFDGSKEKVEDKCALFNTDDRGGPFTDVTECTGERCGLTEWLCSGNILTVDYNADCSKGCKNGACISSESGICTDSDSGFNYFKKGTTKDKTGITKTDFCESSTMLLEYACGGDGLLAVTSNKCWNGCRNGACITGVQTVGNCEDSDGGYNAFKKGTLTFKYSDNRDYIDVITESCTNSKQFDEYFCNDEGKIGSSVATCLYGCKDGACLETSSPVGNPCTNAGYQCTSPIRGCGNYKQIDLSCGDSIPICCQEIPYCGDGVCFVHNTPGYGETPESCPKDCGSAEDSCNGADINNDGVVNSKDNKILSANFNKKDCAAPNWCEGADINRDGKVDLKDFAIMVEMDGRNNCNTRTNICKGADLNNDGVVNSIDQEIINVNFNKGNCAGSGWCNGADINRDGRVDLSDHALLALEYGRNDCYVYSSVPESSVCDVLARNCKLGSEIACDDYENICIAIDDEDSLCRDFLRKCKDGSEEACKLYDKECDDDFIDISECRDGCELNGQCVPLGYRYSGSYCELGGKMEQQKSGGQFCENSVECKSNSCVDNQCTQPGFLTILFEWLSILFGGRTQ